LRLALWLVVVVMFGVKGGQMKHLDAIKRFRIVKKSELF
jgi:hypothetical protein